MIYYFVECWWGISTGIGERVDEYVVSDLFWIGFGNHCLMLWSVFEDI